MALSDYILIERDCADGPSIHVKRSCEPHLIVEFQPLFNPLGKLSGGVLKRVCIQNSWTGDYSKYSKLVAEAEAFFRRSLNEQVPSNRLFPG
ncbi:MAG: hypothetical protein ACFB20_02245 [Opitutales bacterium]